MQALRTPRRWLISEVVPGSRLSEHAKPSSTEHAVLSVVGRNEGFASGMTLTAGMVVQVAETGLGFKLSVSAATPSVKGLGRHREGPPGRLWKKSASLPARAR
jgi:hypothetical protein